MIGNVTKDVSPDTLQADIDNLEKFLNHEKSWEDFSSYFSQFNFQELKSKATSYSQQYGKDPDPQKRMLAIYYAMLYRDAQYAYADRVFIGALGGDSNMLAFYRLGTSLGVNKEDSE